MIVVDSNVIAYCWVRGAQTALAHRVRRIDPDWHAPVLWRSEMRSILTGYLRDGSLNSAQVRDIMDAAETALASAEHYLPSERVFSVAERSRLSAYDCEFVALAEALDVQLVTADRAVLAALPGVAATMEAFLSAR